MIKEFLRIAGAGFLFLAAGCASSRSIISSDIKSEVLQIQNEDGTTENLPYKILTLTAEETDSKYPLIMVLHGSGMDGAQYLNQWKEEAVKHHFMIVAPLRQRGYKNEEANLKGLFQLIDKIKTQYPVDEKKIHLAGVSSGALIARWMMVRRPELWRSVVFIASEPFEDWMSHAPVKKLPPLLYVHGEKDDAYPYQKVQERVRSLRKLKIKKVRLMLDPEAGHEHRTKWNPQIFDWILDQD